MKNTQWPGIKKDSSKICVLLSIICILRCILLSHLRKITLVSTFTIYWIPPHLGSNQRILAFNCLKVCFIFIFKRFYWSIVDLQLCVTFRCPTKWIYYIHIYIYIHTHTHTHFFMIFCHIGYYRVLARVPCAVQ